LIPQLAAYRLGSAHDDSVSRLRERICGQVRNVAMRIRRAVIPVAGLGTRMLPATKAIPKEMVAVAGKPAVQWVVEAASPRAWKRSSS
jgi:hypothetical protein